MKNNPSRPYPPLARRLFSIWYRHVRVYSGNLYSNALPPFLEPLIFLAGVGLGLGRYVGEMEGLNYLTFLGTGLLVTTAMETASFECTFGTFIRLEFDKVYDGMLAAPLSVADLVVGEILWAGTKGLFFSFAVVCIMTVCGVVPMPGSAAVPLVGLATGLMFGSLGLLITAFVKNINHFSFYLTGLISPMFFFSGVVFSIHELPRSLQVVAEIMPLTHSVRLARGLSLALFSPVLLWDAAYIALFTALTAFLAFRFLHRRLVR
jgi:lipooligosaccharide transport system permease protein